MYKDSADILERSDLNFYFYWVWKEVTINSIFWKFKIYQKNQWLDNELYIIIIGKISFGLNIKEWFLNLL